MLIAVPPDHLRQVVHKLVVVLRAQVVQPGEDVPAGAPRDRHPVWRRVGEGLEDERAALPGRQQHPALGGVRAPVPLPAGAPEAALGRPDLRRGFRSHLPRAKKGAMEASELDWYKHVQIRPGSICTSLCWPHSGSLAHQGFPSRSRRCCNGISEARGPFEGRREGQQGSCAVRQGILPPRWQTSKVMYPNLRRAAASYLQQHSAL